MLKLVSKKSNQKGFSLIELMIVVAIIGILSAIAIPNYQRFQERSRQSEAKASLDGFFTAAAAYYAEFNTYACMFDAIGYNPTGSLTYRVSNGAAGTAGPVPAPQGTAGCITTAGAANTVCPLFNGKAAWAEITATTNMGPAAPAAAGTCALTTFTTVASGHIGSTIIDTWSITQNKVVTNVVDGL